VAALLERTRSKLGLGQREYVKSDSQHGSQLHQSGSWLAETVFVSLNPAGLSIIRDQIKNSKKVLTQFEQFT
jgi:hypothetical protein